MVATVLRSHGDVTAHAYTGSNAFALVRPINNPTLKCSSVQLRGVSWKYTNVGQILYSRKHGLFIYIYIYIYI